jgi:hypothetical protein
VKFLELHNYILIPAGPHILYVRKEGDSTTLYQASKTFRAGEYYTAKLIGSKVDNNDAFTIDEE